MSKTYRVSTLCPNCGYLDPCAEIPQGKPVKEMKCPQCKCKGMKSRGAS